MPTYEHEIPARKVRITISSEVIGEVAGFAERMAKVEKILLGLANDPAPGDARGIPISAITPMIARELAMIWEKTLELHSDKLALGKIKKIKALAQSLTGHQFDNLANSGVSIEMINTIRSVADAPMFSEWAIPKKGRSKNKSAQRLANAFVCHFPVLTGKEIGVNADHDFVMTLGEIYKALGFRVKSPQHYAKQAVKAIANERSAAQARADETQRQLEARPQT